jgi:Ca-activated chloride channel family protein
LEITMTEDELERLRELPVPPHSGDAKRLALKGALAAFAGAAKTMGRAQGTIALFGATAERWGSERWRPSAALAAAVTVIAIAVPLALHLTTRPSPPEPDQPVQASPSRAAPSPAELPERGDGRTIVPPSPDEQRSFTPPVGTDRLGNEPPVNRHASLRRDALSPRQAEMGRGRLARAPASAVKSVTSEPVSTFSIDVDTSSYAFVRRSLNAGRLPPKDAVRVEEIINYFPYAYVLPRDRKAPFQPVVTIVPAPWNASNKLMHIAVKGYEMQGSERQAGDGYAPKRPRANLVLLIDTGGSMASEDRLPLLKTAFRMFVDTLRPDDTVGIVTYAGETRVALEPTRAAEKQKIIQAIDKLEASGSTAGAAGIEEAYHMAKQAFDRTAVNRVILATDGNFQVGITDQGALKDFIERRRETGIYLSILGVGRDNSNDTLMQTLAQSGNGVAAYIDTLNEARKVLVDEASSTLFPIAQDVKIEIEFNPAQISEYRLIGYETRILRRQDFDNDKVDAGDIRSGRAVTAIYEITPVSARKERAPDSKGSEQGAEYAFLKIRYKLPKEAMSQLIDLPITQAFEMSAISQTAPCVRFSTAVAAFAQLLRGDPHLRSFGYDDVVALAADAKGPDTFGYRAEFLDLVRLAKSARP